GKTISVDSYEDKEDLTEGIKVAQKVSAAGNYSALIGHFSSNIALATKNTYDDNKVLVLSPMISNIEFTAPPLDYIFRNVASDEAEAEKLLQYASEMEYKNIAVYYRNNDYGSQLSTVVNKRAKDFGITVIDSHGEFVNALEFENQYEKWIAMDVDAIFVGDSMPDAEDIVKMIRGTNPTIPILGAGGFAFSDILGSLGETANGITFIDSFHFDSENAKLQKFTKAFQSAYGEEPGYLSLIGYDTIYLLADAIEKGGSADPTVMADTLKNKGPWVSSTNEFTFDEAGNAIGIDLPIVEIVNETYRYLK
ncbi:MAG: ABC transporter substrate-binding protein, partial [Eubacteriales bacterium]|nr:ABC transporter substrate-binding protein [Eubacteriales bacterium]